MSDRSARLLVVVAVLLGGARSFARNDPPFHVGWREPDHRAETARAIALAQARGGRILEVRADGTGTYGSIQKAVDAAHASDLILVYPGAYREHVEVKNSGKEGRPIVLKAAERGVIIDGEKKHVCILVRGDFVVIDGFECRNAGLDPKGRHPRDGTIKLFGSKGAVVRNCHCHGATDGYKVADISTTVATDYVIQNNRCASKISHSIDCGWKSIDGIVEHNECSGSYSAIYVHAMADRTEVRYNYAHDFMRGKSRWHGSGIVCRDCVGASIHHNLFVGPQASGVLLYDFLYKSHGPGSPGADQLHEGHRVYNNTLVGGMFGIEFSSNVEDCHAKDNVIASASEAAIRFYNIPDSNRSLRLERNVHWKCGRAVEGRYPTAKTALLRINPRFVGFARGDYRLRPDSPLVDAGDPDLTPPPGGGRRVDIGAHELIYEAPVQPRPKPCFAAPKKRPPRDPLSEHAGELKEARELASRREYAKAAAAFDAARASIPDEEARPACAELAERMRRNEELKELILANAAKARGATTYVKVAGAKVRGKVAAVAREGVKVQAVGVEVRLSWGEVSDSTFYGLARRCVPDAPAWHLKLAGSCADAGLKEQALKEAELAMKDPALAEKARSIIEGLR